MPFSHFVLPIEAVAHDFESHRPRKRTARFNSLPRRHGLPDLCVTKGLIPTYWTQHFLMRIQHRVVTDCLASAFRRTQASGRCKLLLKEITTAYCMNNCWFAVAASAISVQRRRLQIFGQQIR